MPACECVWFVTVFGACLVAVGESLDEGKTHAKTAVWSGRGVGEHRCPPICCMLVYSVV